MMRRRSKKNVSSYNQLDTLPPELNRGRRVRSRVFTVYTYLPRPVAIKARREIYPYPYPKQVRKLGRTIRLSLRPSRARLVKAAVRIRLPYTLPLVRGSYVSLSRGRLNIHSRNQLRSALHAQEFNRRRYSEYKRNRRKGSHGQLDSPGAGRFGSVAEVYRKGGSIDQAADAALAARALSRWF